MLASAGKGDANDLGAGLDFLSTKTTFGSRVDTSIPVSNYFGTTTSTNRLNWFKVNIANAFTDSTTLLNLCVENLN